MNLVLFSWFASSDAFGDMVEELDFKSMLYADRSKEIEDDLVPAGFFSAPAGDTTNYEYEEMLRQRQEWHNL